jgi:hypothetical protein
MSLRLILSGAFDRLFLRSGPFLRHVARADAFVITPPLMSWWGDLFPELRDLVRHVLDWHTALRLARTSREEYALCQGLYPHPQPHFLSRYAFHVKRCGWARDPEEVREEMRAFADADLLWLPSHVLPRPLVIGWEMHYADDHRSYDTIGRLFQQDGRLAGYHLSNLGCRRTLVALLRDHLDCVDAWRSFGMCPCVPDGFGLVEREHIPLKVVYRGAGALPLQKLKGDEVWLFPPSELMLENAAWARAWRGGSPSALQMIQRAGWTRVGHLVKE